MLGFPCNQFGEQEPCSDSEIAEFVRSKYQVDFPMFSKIEVNGDNACALYRYLTSAKAAKNGSIDITWNFEKFLVGGDGTVLDRFSPKRTPEDLAMLLPNYLGK